MYSALYYPHTSVEDANLLKTSLLLWDSVTTIVPDAEFSPQYPTRELNDAWTLIGRQHPPSEAEKRSAHEIIQDFVDGPILNEFLYAPQSVLPGDVYEIYPQKLLSATFDLLNQRGLAGRPLPNSDVPASQLMGLHVMNILADCCAGDNMVRITDKESAYDLLSGLLAEKSTSVRSENTREAVVSVTLDVLDLRSIDVTLLIEFRRREALESAGWEYRDLRHRYVDRVEEQLKRLRTARGDAERTSIREEFRDSMESDVKALCGALGTNNFQTGLTYAGIASTALVGAYEAVAYFGGWGPPPSTVLNAVTATSAITGLLMLQSKFGQTRAEVLRKHPMSYLHHLRESRPQA
jgi:hypothetical protein